MLAYFKWRCVRWIRSILFALWIFVKYSSKIQI